MIVSGNGVLSIRRGQEPQLSLLPEQAHYQGTLIGMTFRQEDVQDYANLLQRAKLDTGLLQQQAKGIIFRI